MGFFDRLFGKKNSADSAKERLQLVLIHDRTDLTPAELDSLRDDLIATISRHVEIDAQGELAGFWRGRHREPQPGGGHLEHRIGRDGGTAHPRLAVDDLGVR